MVLTPDQFRQIAQAKHGLGLATGIEEKFYLLLENYADLERVILELGLKNLVFSGHSWSAFQDDIIAVNRRLANLLSATRSYLDQVDHELAAVFGKEGAAVVAVRGARSREYDARLGYRVLEALRNYQQHRGTPVHHLAIKVRRDPVGAEVFVAHHVVPSVSVPELRQDGGFKASVLRELELRGPLVPLMPLVREYVEGLAAVHGALREATADPVSRWEETITAAMARGRKRFGRSGLGFVALGSESTGKREVQMFEDSMNRRKQLERRSRHVALLAKHYVSGRASSGDV